MLENNKIKKLVIHCSDTPDEDNLSAIDIHKMHLSFGWDGIGYHKVILRNGLLQNGRPEYWIGAHVRGINDISLGVCLIGRKNFTKNQFDTLEKLLRTWKLEYVNATIEGHCESVITKKTCPNFDVKSWCKKRGLS